MASTITGIYQGQKKILLTHELSGTTITTDAPPDNNGEGSSFSPTDLVAAALPSCVMTIITIVAERDQIDISGMRAEVEKHMNENPRRIKALPVKIWLPAHLNDKQRKKLEAAARACPVHKSLGSTIDISIEFIYEPT